MDQKEFLNKVHALIALAEKEGGSISKSQMMEPFSGENLNEDQLASIKNFLTGSGVTVTEEGKEKKPQMQPQTKAIKLASKEKKIYESYLEELAFVKKYDPKEEEALFVKKNSGDRAARDRLVEGNLTRVVEIAGKYAGRGVAISDLVQEGNMELILLIDEHDGNGFQFHLANRLGQAMERLIDEANGQDSFKARMADLANKLLDASEEFADNEGVQPTVEDLERRMGA